MTNQKADKVESAIDKLVLDAIQFGATNASIERMMVSSEDLVDQKRSLLDLINQARSEAVERARNDSRMVDIKGQKLLVGDTVEVKGDYVGDHFMKAKQMTLVFQDAEFFLTHPDEGYLSLFDAIHNRGAVKLLNARKT